MKFSKKYIYVFLYAYIFLLVILAIIPINNSESTLNNNYTFSIRWDYLVHAIVMIPLVVLISNARMAYRNDREDLSISLKNIMPIFFLPVLIGITTESIQLLIPYRAFNINDLIANLIGVLLGLLTIGIINPSKRSKPSP